MKRLWTVFLPALLVCGGVFALTSALSRTEARAETPKIDPAVQAAIDAFVKDASKWAEDPALVNEVQDQNKKGPIPEMTEAKWKEQKRRTPLIDGFQNTAAAKMLAQRQKDSNELVCEAFVSAAQGEKVCFLEKTSSYIHKGKSKFDAPFTTGKPWQGEPTFDESTQTHSLQVSLPIFPARKESDDPKAERKPIGVLTIGLNFTLLQENVKKSGK
ncbi:MAG: hypothetical protein IPJ77_02910 [Planctomycetes bacterium]|nr:hypothetical protein [Planctomycetota bacterium]